MNSVSSDESEDGTGESAEFDCGDATSFPKEENKVAVLMLLVWEIEVSEEVRSVRSSSTELSGKCLPSPPSDRAPNVETCAIYAYRGWLSGFT